MNTQLWHVVDIESADGAVLADILSVPADLQGNAIWPVLEMAGLPFERDKVNLLPAAEPAVTGNQFVWNDLCEMARAANEQTKGGAA